MIKEAITGEFLAVGRKLFFEIGFKMLKKSIKIKKLETINCSLWRNYVIWRSKLWHIHMTATAFLIVEFQHALVY